MTDCDTLSLWEAVSSKDVLDERFGIGRSGWTVLERFLIMRNEAVSGSAMGKRICNK